MYTGTCLCKAVSIEIKGPISQIIHCHCSLCRKNSGTAFATNGFVNTRDFTLTKGKDNLTEFNFKPGRARFFCKTCGSPIYSANAEDKSRLRIRLGLIDSDITEQVISHNFVTSKANWEQLETRLPCYEKHEPGR
ncbi:aldehyde-activating protein [Pseudoalteromonas sp. S3776]|uniref:GFA family protein n=1 Tax=Pseudoalteromonas sp. S3776 TaxID=579544 RepID=UPI0011082759|nr:GFA family protein [Pseudoalteromonas sp. S3776]TMO80540.1 aldehyde-activating protein [Pseudoalteromonas sp. S3776]